jgi:hypothetical protein
MSILLLFVVVLSLLFCFPNNALAAIGKHLGCNEMSVTAIVLNGTTRTFPVCTMYELGTSCARYELQTVNGVQGMVCTVMWCPRCRDECLSMDMYVRTRGLGYTRLGDLELGDWVAVDTTNATADSGCVVDDNTFVDRADECGVRFEQVIDIPHRDSGKVTWFVRIKVDDNAATLTVTANHLVYAMVDGAVTSVFARDISVGMLLVSSASAAASTDYQRRVIAIEHVVSRGIIAPHTSGGRLLVYDHPDNSASGLLVSCYSTFNAPALLHQLFRIRRWIQPASSVELVEHMPLRQAHPLEERILNLL